MDALHFSGYEGSLETVLGRGQMVSGIAMLVGSVAGGVIAQATNLGVPFLLRVAVLVAMFAVAFLLMHDVGFTPERSAAPLQATRAVLKASLDGGLRNPPVRYMMLAAPFTEGVGIYVFYALQPYLLQLFGDPRAYAIAGLAAAIVAGADIVGGWLAPLVRKLVHRRTTVLIGSATWPAQWCWWCCWFTTRLLAGAGSPGPVGDGGFGRHTGSPGVPQRHDRLQAAGDGAQLRLAHGFERRGGGTAAAGTGRGPLRVPCVLGNERRSAAAGGTLHPAEQAAALAGGCRDGPGPGALTGAGGGEP